MVMEYKKYLFIGKVLELILVYQSHFKGKLDKKIFQLDASEENFDLSGENLKDVK